MRKSALVVTVAAGLATLFVALIAFGDGGSRSAEAGVAPPAQSDSANVDLIGSTQSWKVTSKGDFPFNRVIVNVANAGAARKLSSATFRCQSTTEEVVSIAPKAGPAVSGAEIWSATFQTKCPAASGVNVTLTPRDPTNKITITDTDVRVQNTSLPQVGAINFARIRRNPQLWKITFKDPTKGYNRIDLEIGAPAGVRKVRRVFFFCQSAGGQNDNEHDDGIGRVAVGAPKDRLPGVNPVEVWSGTFTQKCTGGVWVVIIPINPRNQVVIKTGHAENTTRPREADANAYLKGKSETFKITSKATTTFSANRVEIDVGSAQNTPLVSSSPKPLFVCQDGSAKKDGTYKGIVKNVNLTPGDPLPNHEIWGAEFANKCIGPGSGVTVTLFPIDPTTQLVIKSARVQNTIPTPTPTATPTLLPDASPCAKTFQSVPFPHRPEAGLWDFWKCSPADPALDWNRVDIYVESPGPNQKLSAVQFDCQDNFNDSAGFGSKAGTVTKKTPPDAPPGQEIWSGEDFIDPKLVPPQAKNCTGGVTVAILPAVVGNHPIIKEAIFSHAGPAKPAPTPRNDKPPCPVQPDLPFPEPGCDQQASTISMVVTIAGVGDLTCTLAGDTSIARGPVVQKTTGLDSIDTQIFFGKLAGTCQSLTASGLPVMLHFKPSSGRIDEQANSQPGILEFPAVSSFDVFFNIDTPIGPLHNNDPAPVSAVIDRIPPKGSIYRETNSVPLYDTNNQVVGKLQPGGTHTLSTPTPTPTRPAPSTKPPANGTCVVVIAPTIWACFPNASVSHYDRIDISVGKEGLGGAKIQSVLFQCQNPNEPIQHVQGSFKYQKLNGSLVFPFADVWSGTFSPACSGVVIVSFNPTNQNNSPVIKKVVFSTTGG